MGALIGQGLILMALGMGMVFLALALLWGLITLLTRVLPAHQPAADTVAAEPAVDAAQAVLQDEAQAAAALVDERARVAALVAAALLANAIPIRSEVPVGPVFEHGRTAPCWVTANRSRMLQPWYPQRRPESAA